MSEQKSEQGRGYVRRVCSQCNEDLSFSEGDPCDKCGDNPVPQPDGVVEAPEQPDGLISFDYHEDAESLPSVQQLRVDRRQWLRTFCLHSGVHWDGKSALSESEQIRLLKAAIEPGCCKNPDLGYYLRHAAYGFAEAQRRFREGHHEYQTLVDVIHRQREELARLNEQVRGSTKNAAPSPDSIAEKAQGAADQALYEGLLDNYETAATTEARKQRLADIIAAEFQGGGK